MFEPTKDDLANMKKYGFKYRLRSHTNLPTKDFPHYQSAIFCEIMDEATSVWFCEAEGPDEQTALTNAIKKAIAAPKPKTKAQQDTTDAVDSAVAEKEALIVKQRAEIEEQKARIAELSKRHNSGGFGRRPDRLAAEPAETA